MVSQHNLQALNPINHMNPATPQAHEARVLCHLPAAQSLHSKPYKPYNSCRATVSSPASASLEIPASAFTSGQHPLSTRLDGFMIGVRVL